ncbi:MAG: FabA/FabZ family ACP-dehydratase [Planctomycetota bacterium]|nr:FabA/FabZ family ACP-dehydratase [Planctomycetota bacterium]
MQTNGPADSTVSGEDASRSRFLVDLASIDLKRVLVSKAQLEDTNPHRGVMALLDAVIWESDDRRLTVGVKHNRSDEFWCAGHFPGKPVLPGVLQIEAGAQLACYNYNSRNRQEKRVVLFTRIEDASFRMMVEPGDDLYIICKEVKMSKRRFVTDVQGIVNGKLAFEARVCGMQLAAGEDANA